jgi:hypothetical protein
MLGFFNLTRRKQRQSFEALKKQLIQFFRVLIPISASAPSAGLVLTVLTD